MVAQLVFEARDGVAVLDLACIIVSMPMDVNSQLNTLVQSTQIPYIQKTSTCTFTNARMDIEIETHMGHTYRHIHQHTHAHSVHTHTHTHLYISIVTALVHAL